LSGPRQLRPWSRSIGHTGRWHRLDVQLGANSLPTQRDCRIDSGCLPRRHVTSQKCGARQSHDSERRRHWVVCPYSEQERCDTFRGAQRLSAGPCAILAVVGGMSSRNSLGSRRNASTQEPGRSRGRASRETLNDWSPLIPPVGGSCSLANMERRRSWRNPQTSDGAMHYSQFC